MIKHTQLKSEQLYRHCDKGELTFTSTAELKILPMVIGQSRALDAVDFGVNIDGEGYNLFVMGPTGVGKYSLVKQFLDDYAKNKPVSQDWGYLNNFSDAQKPWNIALPAGQGTQLRHDIDKMVTHLIEVLPRAFDDEYYRGRIRSIEEESRKHRVRLFGVLQVEADKQGIILLRMQDSSYAFAAKRDGEPLTSEEFDKLSAAEQEEAEESIAQLHSDLQHTLLELREWEQDNAEKIAALNDEVGLEVISREIDNLRHAYPRQKILQQYFSAMEKDIRANVDAFLKNEDSEEAQSTSENSLYRRYQINLIVDQSDTVGAPVVYENLPSHESLLGRVENMAMMGALVTDFSLIKGGAVHRANGGYLILDVEQLLMQPYAWEGLKRALQAKELRFDDLERMYSLVSTVSLEPEPIPLDLKIILLGDRHLYYLLYEQDPDFAELFKVAADFEDQMERNAENHLLYARMIASTIQTEHFLHLDSDAVAVVIEYGARAVEDSEKFSLHHGDLTDLLREANYCARKHSKSLVSRQHIQQAIDNRIQRADRFRGAVYEQIQRGVVHIDVTGERVGQVNGLSVMESGGFSFAQPSRISANCRFGDGDIVDIEREVELGGEIHSKGVLIMSGYLGATYAKDRPLSMSASLVFEQNYGEVDGDSASMAELCALLSAISEVPIKQSWAITGSVNQHGDAQAIGGVNEKIEGFYDVCKLLDFTGKQGVIIPQSNVQHLMLRQDVIDAVETGAFQIHAVATVTDALCLLTGMTVGELNKKGTYPPRSFNAAVARRIKLWEEVHKHEKDSTDEKND